MRERNKLVSCLSYVTWGFFSSMHLLLSPQHWSLATSEIIPMGSSSSSKNFFSKLQKNNVIFVHREPEKRGGNSAGPTWQQDLELFIRNMKEVAFPYNMQPFLLIIFLLHLTKPLNWHGSLHQFILPDRQVKVPKDSFSSNFLHCCNIKFIIFVT